MKNNLYINLIFFLIISLVVFIFGISLISTVDANLPFYRWDMDHSTVLDSYYLGSNLMPSHLAHPGVGLNFIILIYQKFLYQLGFLSSLSFDHLESSVNFFLPYAEKMYYLRLLSPILIFFIVFFSAVSLNLLISKNKILLFALFFVPLSTLNSLWVHNLQIRTELYSILFFSLTFFCLVVLKKTNYKSSIILILSFLFGIFCVVTKFQSFLVLIIFFLLFYIFDYSQIFLKKKNYQEKKIKNLEIFYYLNLLFFLIILFFSYNYEISSSLKIGAFRGNYNNIFKSYFFIFFIFINFLIFYSTNKNKIFFFSLNESQFLIKIFKSLILVIAALNIFFLLHLFLPMNLTANWEFLLLNFKLIFLSKLNIEATMTEISSVSLNIFTISKSIPLIYNNFLSNFSKHYFQYISLVASMIFLFFNYFKDNNKANKFSKNILVICHILLIFHLIKFTRAGTWNHRDGIYTEYVIFMFIISCLYLTLNFSRNKKYNLYFLYSYLSITTVLSLFNLNYLNQVDYHQNYSFFQTLVKPVGGEKIERFIKDTDTYSYTRTINFKKIIDKNYLSEEEVLKHIKQSLNFDKIKTILRTSHSTYLNNIDLKSVGVIQKNSKLNLNNKIIEIIDYDERLHNKFLVKFKNSLQDNKYHYFVNGNPWSYQLIVFYDKNLIKSSPPCFEKAKNFKMTIKKDNKLINLNSYKPIRDCKFVVKNLDKTLFYTFFN